VSNGRRFDANDEREWEAQERARIAEQSRTPLADDDAAATRYRVLARELGALKGIELPAGFAEAVACRAAIRAVEPALALFERVMVATLIVAFVTTAGIGVATFGLSSPVIEALRDAGSNRWMLAFASCLAACAMTARLRVPARR
jgi:hypothetical protein